ncbi:hypothetical protein M752DRAFT_277514 [Aspergillus phoenicis ATCC 13157]|nr:hypothetical protein M752DRAFT_277514 [Aspergillus phoenicis ATCC 13157]
MALLFFPTAPVCRVPRLGLAYDPGLAVRPPDQLLLGIPANPAPQATTTLLEG